jgi:DNA replication and repair protein RecF
VSLRSLTLETVRNYREASVTAPPGLILVTGPNAAGKTNLLEAIYYLAVCRSFRGARDRDLVQQGARGWRLAANVAGPAGERRLELSYEFAAGKRAAVNEEPFPRLVDFVGTFAAAAFVPEDMALVRGEPAVRRRFLDMWLGQGSREYLYNLQRYGEVLVRRNALLARGASRAERLPYDHELVEAGAFLVAYRARACEGLAAAAAAAYAELAPAGETFAAAYVPSVAPAAADRREVAAAFEAALARVAPEEEERRQTVVGPHRDDLAFAVEGREARRYASEGQQRTAALALRLAQYRLLAAARAEPPVLLLDDVTSTLDGERQRRLFEAVAGAPQVWFTAPARPPALKPDAEFSIAHGLIAPRP